MFVFFFCSSCCCCFFLLFSFAFAFCVCFFVRLLVYLLICLFVHVAEGCCALFVFTCLLAFLLVCSFCQMLLLSFWFCLLTCPSVGLLSCLLMCLQLWKMITEQLHGTEIHSVMELHQQCFEHQLEHHNSLGAGASVTVHKDSTLLLCSAFVFVCVLLILLPEYMALIGHPNCQCAQRIQNTMSKKISNVSKKSNK